MAVKIGKVTKDLPDTRGGRYRESKYDVFLNQVPKVGYLPFTFDDLSDLMRMYTTIRKNRYHEFKVYRRTLTLYIRRVHAKA